MREWRGEVLCRIFTRVCNVSFFRQKELKSRPEKSTTKCHTLQTISVHVCFLAGSSTDCIGGKSLKASIFNGWRCLARALFRMSVVLSARPLASTSRRPTPQHNTSAPGVSGICLPHGRKVGVIVLLGKTVGYCYRTVPIFPQHIRPSERKPPREATALSRRQNTAH